MLSVGDVIIDYDDVGRLVIQVKEYENSIYPYYRVTAIPRVNWWNEEMNDTFLREMFISFDSKENTIYVLKADE